MSQVLEEPAKNLTPILTDMAREGRITTKGWGKGCPLYVIGKA
jgi:hypothetical protein